jgi:hypothetical protein
MLSPAQIGCLFLLRFVLDAWMMSGEERKLLSGAAGFLFTLGE